MVYSVKFRALTFGLQERNNNNNNNNRIKRGQITRNKKGEKLYLLDNSFCFLSEIPAREVIDIQQQTASKAYRHYIQIYIYHKYIHNKVRKFTYS